MAGEDGTLAHHGKKKTADDEFEPVFFHGKCSDLYEELLWTLGGPSKIKQIIDFCPGQGALAQLALRKRLPYCAFCFTEHHLSGLQDHLVKLLLKLFVEEGSEFYKPGLAATMKDVEADPAEDDPNDDDDHSGDGETPPTAAANKKAKAKAKAKGKKGAGKGKNSKKKGGRKPKTPKALRQAAQDGGDGEDFGEEPEEEASEESDSEVE